MSAAPSSLGGDMPNPRFNNLGQQKVSDSGKPTTKRGKPAPSVKPDRTANWPGVPGKTQPGGRLVGVPEVKGTLHKEGL